MSDRETVASHVPPAGDLAHNPDMCPDWELNWWLFGLQAGAQSAEPHQPESYVLHFTDEKTEAQRDFLKLPKFAH